MKRAFGSETKVTDGGLICKLGETHYIVDRTIGATNEVMEATRFAFNTGDVFNIISQ